MTRTLTAVALTGRIVTLAALLVLGGAVGSLLDGVPADGIPTVTSTIGGPGR